MLGVFSAESSDAIPIPQVAAAREALFFQEHGSVLTPRSSPVPTLAHGLR